LGEFSFRYGVSNPERLGRQGARRPSSSTSGQFDEPCIRGSTSRNSSIFSEPMAYACAFDTLLHMPGDT